ADGRLMPAAAANISAYLAAGLPDWAMSSIGELVESQAWSELNDRFYRELEFGTGGMRGRTVGAVTSRAETGTPGADGAPEHAGVGSNLLNDMTLARAVIGLFRYTQGYLRGQGQSAAPRLVIAHDVRFFSRHFCELAASIWSKLGGDAFIFDGPRPTPQLSFTVRRIGAHAGAVITASHNPPHDNGFKAYFVDGGQVVPPHDKGIAAGVAAVPLGAVSDFLHKDLARVTVLGRAMDDAYLEIAATAVVDPAMLRAARLKVVYSNIHGTGAVHCPPLLIHAGCNVIEVVEQLEFDPRFSTVKSPNPENAEALSMGVATANRRGCDVVMATDPDCDRMGVAVRGGSGEMELLTGNQIGAMIAEYRLVKLKELGRIPPAGSPNACIIKTFVTTGLQDAIGRAHGVKVINTLTGFKWIGAKILHYEGRLRRAMGPGWDYDRTALAERARLLQEHSTFFVFGTEESYGYLPNDNVRDKDGNAACLMFSELCAWVKGQGITVPEYLDRLYLKYGFFLEDTINIYYEGASGSAKIGRILETYRGSPPRSFGDVRVTGFQDFGRERILDADGEEIPKQDLYIVALSNGYRFAARGSGTEPKMKFYLFASDKVPDPSALPAVKERVRAELDRLKGLIGADARSRAEG
ncbi:MAG TPA: phospho-sugar mutase, partial [Opitutaceae bacterium]|nr:phospho-sugar mutase [Opitutaceae bacterium]